MPPHWREGTTEEHGSRWAGQAITVDSMIVDNAPPRVFGLDNQMYAAGDAEPELADLDLRYSGESAETDFYASLGDREEL